MPLDADVMKAKLEPEIFNNLKQAFSPYLAKGSNYPPLADDMLMKLATAVADAVSKIVVQEIQTNAIVVPGQAVVTAGGPTNQAGATVSPGTIK